MDMISHLADGLLICLQPFNLLMLLVGIVFGLLVGVLPGLTLVMGVALTLPFTYHMDITPAIILLTAMYVSGTYGGAFTSILFRIPGEPIDVPLLWDGYTMARAGQPSKALGWTLLAAFCGGTLSAIIMVMLTAPMARFALRFSSPEYFALVVFGLTSVISLARSSLANAVISLCMGLVIAAVGTDATYGASRFSFGLPILADGIEFIVVMVGAYGIGEVLSRLERGFNGASVISSVKATTEFPSLRAIRGLSGVFLRSAILGNIIGIVPGAGATIASFVGYGVEGQIGKRKAQMGTGIPEGIVAPQSAATASVGGAMVPLLAIGIPGSGATAIILGAFMLHGIQPGPQVLVNSPDIIYAIFASLFLGILVMSVLGYFAVRPLIKVLDLPEAAVSAFVMLFCFIGALSIRSNITDLWLMIAFGVVGYLFDRLRFPIAPMVLGVILGPFAEESFINAMISNQNDWSVFFTRPISACLLLLTALVLIVPLVAHLRPSLRLAPTPAKRRV